MKELYICNGRNFSTFKQVEDYCAAQNFRVQMIETIGLFTYLVSVTNCEPNFKELSESK